MLYLAIPAQNEVATIGVLLWRLRTVLAEFPREYEVVVYDDASSDETADVADQYAEAMPVTVLRGKTPVGYAGAVDALVRHVSAATRYPRRDAILLLQGDFTDPPGIVPEFARRFEGGADLVVGDRTAVVDAPVPVKRLFSAAGWALRPFVRVDGVRDLTGSMRLVRVSVLRDLLRASNDAPVCEGDTWTANADLLLRLVPHARRVETVSMEPTYGVRMRDTRRVTVRDALASLRWGWRARGRRAVPTTAPESTADRNRAEPVREGTNQLRDAGRDAGGSTRDPGREGRDANREGTGDASRDASPSSAPPGRRRDGTRDAAKDGGRLETGNGIRERTGNGTRDEAKAARLLRPAAKADSRGEKRLEPPGEPRAKRLEATESLEESAARALQREAARAARRDASREPKRDARRPAKDDSPRDRVDDAAVLLNDPFAPPPKREDPLAALDRTLADQSRQESSPGGPVLDSTVEPASGAGRPESVPEGDSLAENSPGDDTPERKRRRNRRSRRRRGARGELNPDGPVSPDLERDGGGMGASFDGHSEDEPGNEGAHAARNDAASGPVEPSGRGQGDGEESGHDDAEGLDGAQDPVEGETESEARARRRGRRGRRGGARRSRGRGKRGDVSGEDGAGGDDSRGPEPTGSDQKPLPAPES